MSENDVLVTQQINDLIITISLRACLDQCIDDLICENNCLRLTEVKRNCEDSASFNKKTSNMKIIYSPPDHKEILNIMTNEEYSEWCRHLDYHWTEWNSVTKSDADDFETLLDHRRLYGWIKRSIVLFFNILRVCDSPTNVDGRQVDSKISWLGSDLILVYDSKSSYQLFPDTINNDPIWAHGISKDFG